MKNLNCAEIEKNDWIERYLRGDLNDGDVQRLEEHLLTCKECHEHLEDLSLLRASLSEDRWAVADEQRASRVQWGWAWAAAATLLAGAVILWPRLADQPSQGDVDMARLSAVEAPPYEPIKLRAVASEGERRFREAMPAYQKGAFTEAIPGLEVAVALDPELAQAHFYLGACFLLSDQPGPAIGSFGRVVQTEDPRYLEWAYLYRAKAYLRVADLESARRDLGHVVGMQGELAAEAQEVLDQLSE